MARSQARSSFTATRPMERTDLRTNSTSTPEAYLGGFWAKGRNGGELNGLKWRIYGKIGFEDVLRCWKWWSIYKNTEHTVEHCSFGRETKRTNMNSWEYKFKKQMVVSQNPGTRMVPKIAG